jgi:anti-sigma B factor antagonist
MELSSHEEKGCTVLKLDGRLDTLATAGFDTQWKQWIDDGGRRLVLDLAGLRYISSSGLGSIVALAKRLQDLGGRVAIAGLNGVVKEVFSITTIDKVIPVESDVAEALGRL